MCDTFSLQAIIIISVSHVNYNHQVKPLHKDEFGDFDAKLSIFEYIYTYDWFFFFFISYTYDWLIVYIYTHTILSFQFKFMAF